MKIRYIATAFVLSLGLMAGLAALALPNNAAHADDDELERPGAVRSLEAKEGGDRILVAWLPPSTGGPVEQYVAWLKDLDTDEIKQQILRPNNRATEFSGLKKGGDYGIQVYARNKSGNGPPVSILVLNLGCEPDLPRCSDGGKIINPPVRK